MAYTTIDNPELYFQCKLYTGNATARSITLDGSEDMQPDFVWIKRRNSSRNHALLDSVRGGTKQLVSNLTNDEGTDTGLITSFDSNGFSIGTSNDCNSSSDTYVAWCWKAGGSASSNSNGTISSSVSANTTAGFSILTYTGTGSAATIGHGLGAKPKTIWLKERNGSGTQAWSVFHEDIDLNKRMILNSTEAEYDDNPTPDWNETDPTTSVFSVGATSYRTNINSANFVAYCFTDIKGYSKFGSYVANGNSDNVFVYTGFRPSFLMTKLSSHEGGGWEIVDNKRDGYNGENNRLYPNDNAAEGTGNDYDLLSNGFKVRQSGGNQQSGRTNIYMAFAESPFVNSNGVPTNAR